MEILTHREAAILIWIGIFCLFLYSSPKMRAAREAFKRVIKKFFVLKIQVVLILMATYIALMLYGLAEFGIWDITELKNTIVWSCTFAFMSLFELEKIKRDRRFFKHSVLDSIKLIPAIEFLIGSFTFSLVWELVLVPVIFWLVLVGAFSERESKYAQVSKLVDLVLVSLGFLMITYAGYCLISEPSSFFNSQSLYDFILPQLLTVLFIPFVFILILFTTYESVFSRLEILIKTRKYRLFGKLLAFIIFNVRIELLERWAKSVALIQINSYKDVWLSIKKILKMKRAEENPKIIDKKDGWSPYQVKEILSSNGLQTGFYQELYGDGDWFANSNMMELGSDIIPNNIAFYVEGDENVAKVLKLKINVNEIEKSKLAHEKLLEFGRKVYKFAIEEEMPSCFIEALAEGKNLSKKINNYSISVVRDDFLNTRHGGYDVKFMISR